MKSSISSSAVDGAEHLTKDRNRRPSLGVTALRGLIAAAAMLATSAAHAERSFKAIDVDTSAVGSSQTSREIRAALGSRLRETFAQNLTRDKNAPSLIVRITGVTIQSTPYFGGRSGIGGGNTDYLEGEALVVGRGGVILQRYPMLSALNSFENGWYLPDYEKRKAIALSNHYAYWLKRQLPEQ